MKVRNGFVSNSSSTSFTCEICGHSESGWDSVGIEDFGFAQCPNEHVICLEEVLEESNEIKESGFYSLSLEEKRVWLRKDCGEDLDDIEEDDKIENMDEEQCNELYTDECCDTGETIKQSQCPICLFKCISNKNAKRYLIKEYSVPEDEVFKKIKEANKRRKVVHDFEYVAYVFDKMGLNEKKYLEDIKNKFKTYKEFMKYIYNGKTEDYWDE